MYKSKLQEFCQKRSWNLPEYTTVKDGLHHNPRFTTTVYVNGVTFETPKDQCRSSKEAQNLAAQIAFDHFTGALTILQPPNNPIPSPSAALPAALPCVSGSSCSSTDAGIRPTDQGMMHPQQDHIAQASRINKIPFGSGDGKRPKDVLHMYKNKLQHYAQKHTLSFPAYSCQSGGPDHARQFKGKVTFGGKTYVTLEFFPTLKEAEHAAAKVAFEALPHDDAEEDEVLYKTLLQELAQKEGLLFPLYVTNTSGPSHVPTFVATVEIGSDVFQGQEAKTKKQAELRAAKVAYNALIECKAAQFPPSGHMKETSEVTSPKVQSIICKGLEQEIANVHPLNTEGAAHSKECNSRKAVEISSSSERFVVPTDLQQIIQPTAELIANKQLNTEVQDAKRYRCSSSSEEVNAHLQNPLPHDTASFVTSENQKQSGVGNVFPSKTAVYSCNTDMAIPDGASMLPYSDDQWVAMTVELNQVQ